MVPFNIHPDLNLHAPAGLPGSITKIWNYQQLVQTTKALKDHRTESMKALRTFIGLLRPLYTRSYDIIDPVNDCQF
jgi:hypothetical protein